MTIHVSGIISASEIKTQYESNANTNEFDDTEQTKLGGCDTGAKDDQTGAEIKTAYEGQSNAYTDTKNTKLAGIATGADVTPTFFSTPIEVTGTRASATIYQNTSGKPMLVTINSYGDGTAGTKGIVLSASPNADMASSIDIADGQTYNVNGVTNYASFVSAIVPDDYYYRAAVDANHTIQTWTETT